MSYQLMGWAAEQTTGSGTRKAVLLALANSANHRTGECFPSVEQLCEETELKRTAVKDAIAELTKQGLISRVRRRRADGSLSTYEYEFPHVSRETANQGRETTLGLGAGNDPLNQELPSNQKNPPVVPPNEVQETALAVVSKRVSVVDRKAVSVAEHEAAVDVLDRWNERTGQKLAADGWLAKIVRRVREYPDLTVTDHEAIIVATLADPWWKGAASPSLVYGSGEQFERCIEHARAKARGEPSVVKPGRYGRGLTTSQIGEIFKGGGDG